MTLLRAVFLLSHALTSPCPCPEWCPNPYDRCPHPSELHFRPSVFGATPRATPALVRPCRARGAVSSSKTNTSRRLPLPARRVCLHVRRNCRRIRDTLIGAPARRDCRTLCRAGRLGRCGVGQPTRQGHESGIAYTPGARGPLPRGAPGRCRVPRRARAGWAVCCGTADEPESRVT